ncbi:hypothetical protein OE88DRAFT_1723822 [Heliocybe sulcata]|uniref:Uncharacterized protein n=1 Tax=Heliocybe sulcata TaxID=5364 RepID=A0A5C3N9L6_9AGAM|nr:hypothetical protein OE88DRAFT_1723822 [Heliocybe sulcata]
MTTEVDILNATIPGSRQPIRIAPSPDSSDSGLSSSPSASRAKYPSISTTRRKPRVTSQSPSGTHPTALRIEPPSQASSGRAPSSTSSNYKQLGTQINRKSKAKDGGDDKKEEKGKRHIGSMGPPLPLYHPLGRLAQSLPELDPELFGLPSTLFAITIDDSRRASGRARRPAAKLREASEDKAVPPDEADKPNGSPRKRRGGGKRKRRDPDLVDGDSTYPAKRMRKPAEEEAEGEEVVTEEKKAQPERRSRRTRAVVRRNSSASEATTTRSASHRMEVDVPEPEVDGEETNATAVPTPEEPEVPEAEAEVEVEAEPMQVVKPEETPAPSIAVSEKEPEREPEKQENEKEEGELSEEPEDRTKA